MQSKHIKQLCICPDALPVIIKINPCPGEPCPYAKEPSFYFSEDSSIYSEYSFSESVSSEIISSLPSSKSDRSSSTSEGKKSVGSSTSSHHLKIVDCEAFEPGGKCINDAGCATSSSLQEISTTRVSKSIQVICEPKKIIEDQPIPQKEEEIEPIMWIQSTVNLNERKESLSLLEPKTHDREITLIVNEEGSLLVGEHMEKDEIEISTQRTTDSTRQDTSGPGYQDISDLQQIAEGQEIDKSETLGSTKIETEEQVKTFFEVEEGLLAIIQKKLSQYQVAAPETTDTPQQETEENLEVEKTGEPSQPQDQPQFPAEIPEEKPLGDNDSGKQPANS